MNTYVFGAGASVHAGYPIARSMGTNLIQWMETHDDIGSFGFRASAQFLREHIGQIDDTEYVFTEIDRRIAAAKDLHPRPIDVVALCNRHKPALIAAIRMWFTEIRLGEPLDYCRFAGSIASPGDYAITFNYDVALESQLQKHGKWWVGDGYGFSLGWDGQSSAIKLLKLHGSVNWRLPVGWNGRPWIDSSEISFLGFPGQVDPLYRQPIADGAATMILPARCKQFFVETSLGRMHEQFWNSLWNQGAAALSSSEKIILCGYSLPSVDARACKLLMEGHYSAPIQVCCGNDTESIVKRLRAAGKNAYAAPETYFDGWLDRCIRT